MPPRSPLPQRHGLNPAWVSTPQRDAVDADRWVSMGEWLQAKVGATVDVEGFLATGRFVYADGTAVAAADRFEHQNFVWFHRDLRPEPVVPGTIDVVYRDERIIVVDKPAFLSTIPRGNHVRQSLVVRLRDELELPELAPMHRLDRITSGLVLCTVRRQDRAVYQSMFEAGTVSKVYRALAPWLPELEESVTVRNHIAPIKGTAYAQIVEGAEPNAESVITVERRLGAQATYRLEPRTGRTHQLRLHMLGLGAPIMGDPLYPTDRKIDIDDFTEPLQLLASELSFVDPIDGSARAFTSTRSLPL